MFTVSLLCLVAKVSRQSYYKWRGKKQQANDLLTIVAHEQRLSGNCIGYRKMKCLLANEYGLCVGKNKLLKLMRESELLSVIRRKKASHWQLTRKESYVAKNILDRQFRTHKALHKLAVDITYIPIPNSMVYMSAVIDLFNNELLGYQLSQRQDASLSTELIRCLNKRHSLTGSIIHSDQGVHFANKAYVELLKAYGVIQSMSRRGNCWDNAVIESFFGHFKSECIKLRKKALKSFADVKEAVEEYINYYNNRRPQQRLDGLAPVKYRLKMENS